MADTLDIIHVSDVHLGRRSPRFYRLLGAKRGKGRVVEALADAVRTIVSRDDVTTVAVLSGDLSTLGDPQDIGETRFWWKSIAGSPSIYVLGNHDFWNGQPARTAPWHADIHAATRGAHWPNDGVWRVVIGNMRVTIYEVDTTPSGGLTGLRTNVFAKGEIYKRVADKLTVAVNAQTPRSRGADVSVVVMHHPVEELRKGLVGIADLGRSGRINLVLAGHTHEFGRATFSYVQETCASSTLHHRKESPSFLVHTVTHVRGPHVSLQSTLWTFDGGSFVARPLPGSYDLT